MDALLEQGFLKVSKLRLKFRKSDRQARNESEIQGFLGVPGYFAVKMAV